jgi:hypothetical protein
MPSNPPKTPADDFTVASQPTLGEPWNNGAFDGDDGFDMISASY